MTTCIAAQKENIVQQGDALFHLTNDKPKSGDTVYFPPWNCLATYCWVSSGYKLYAGGQIHHLQPSDKIYKATFFIPGAN